MRSVKAGEILPDLLAMVGADETLEVAAERMLLLDIGSLPVVDQDGRLVGIITDADFVPRPATSAASPPGPRVFGRPVGPQQVEQIFRDARNRRVREVMSAPVVTIGADDPVSRALELMFAHRVRHLPVVRDGRPIGVISSRDLLRLMLEDR